MQPPSPATPALQYPHTEARAAMHRTATSTPQHAKQRRTEHSNKHPKCIPVRRRPTVSRSNNMPDPHNPARSSPVRKPTPKPTGPKPKPTKKPIQVHPVISPGQPARPNHADPSDPPPPDRTGTGVRNRNPDKEPESEPEPPRSKRCPSPPPPHKKTYTHPNI
ncbi:hypothetical protein CRENBAI_023586 [Crenichthys baileyi]|uniref:Uncharacterized protein n=1 Tax=Crenichthys baileyi TaxID=28760 RepID=A0AAV9QS25_9TELE